MGYAGPYVVLIFLLCGSLSDGQQSCDPVFHSAECTLNNMGSAEFDGLSCDGREFVNNFEADITNIKDILRNICCAPISTGPPVSTIPTCSNITVVVTLPFKDLVYESTEEVEHRFNLSYRCLSEAPPVVDINVCNQPPITAPAIRVHGQLRPDTCSCQVLVHQSSQLSVLSPDVQSPGLGVDLGLYSFNLMNSKLNETVALSDSVGQFSTTCANNSRFNLIPSESTFRPLNITLVVAASSNITVSCQSMLSTTVMMTEKALNTDFMTTSSVSLGDAGNSMTASNIAIVAGGISAGVTLIIVIVAVIAYCILRKKTPERNPVNTVDNSDYTAPGRSVNAHAYETPERNPVNTVDNSDYTAPVRSVDAHVYETPERNTVNTVDNSDYTAPGRSVDAHVYETPERNPVNTVDNFDYTAPGRSVNDHTYETTEPYTILQPQIRASNRSENPYDELNDSEILAN